MPGAPPEHLFRQLVAAYLAGADEVALVEPGGITAETRAIARTFGRRAVQNGSASEEGERLVLRDVPTGPEPELSVLLERMFHAVHAMQATAGALLDPDGRGELASLLQHDDEVDRLAWRVERDLTNGLEPYSRRGAEATRRLDPLSPLLLARALERVGDHAVILGENAARLAECPVPEPVGSALRAYHRQALDYLESAFQVAENPDVERANELIDTGEALLAAHATLTERFLVRDEARELTPLASACLGLVLQSIDRTAAYAQDIAQVGLDRAIAAGIGSGRSDRSIGTPSAIPATSSEGRSPSRAPGRRTLAAPAA